MNKLTDQIESKLLNYRHFKWLNIGKYRDFKLNG